MASTLIIGYGKMGRIYGKHLSELGVSWDWYDPHIEGGVDCITSAHYAYIIITTPIHTHVDVYRHVMAQGFCGPVLCEKPVVAHRDDLAVLDDRLLYAGLCERWNPAWLAFCRRYTREEVLGMQFYRETNPSDPLDVAVHDLDLWVEWEGLTKPPGFGWHSDTKILHAFGKSLTDATATFQWRTGDTGERRIKVGLRNGKNVHIDLAKQTIDGVSLPGGWVWPIKAMLASFLERPTAWRAMTSHEALFNALDVINMPHGV